MAKRLSVTATYRKLGHLVEVPVSVVDDSGPAEVHGTDEISSATVALKFNDSVIASQDLSKFNGTSEGYAFVFFLNPIQTVGLSVDVSVTLIDTSTLEEKGVSVSWDDTLPLNESPTNPNADPAPGDML